MAIKAIDASTLKKIFIAGAMNLDAKKEWINELNVFPVPDGDTGTNMTLTIMSAVKAVQALESVTIETLAKAISSGSLRGARGNSGVILSQILRGFTKGIQGYQEIDARVFADAFMRGTETAYKAVMKPKEGTILTVARCMAEKALELAPNTKDMESYIEQIIICGDEVLARTPDMLPVLKQAGVVDSGGQGLMQVMKGMHDALCGRVTVDTSKEEITPQVTITLEHDDVDITFGYCTEFIVNIGKDYSEKDEQDIKVYLESIGDSLVVVSDDDLIKIHVHTNDPGLALQKGLSFGSLSRIKIDNMREEHHEKLIKDAEKIARQQKETAAAQHLKNSEEPAAGEPIFPEIPGADDPLVQAAPDSVPEERKPFGFIVVSVGDGMGEIFTGLNVDYIITGGQTMNPSTEDMLNAIAQVNADTIYIFPNNKNIILAAEQAKRLTEDKNIIVVPSKTVPQGITAIINFSPEAKPEENLELMMTEMGHVKSGQVTYAVRHTMVDSMEINEGDIMGIGDHAILSVSNDIQKTTLDLLDKLVDENSELISIYYGSDIDEEKAEEIQSVAEVLYPDCDVEVHNGGQPIYYYIMSVE